MSNEKITVVKNINSAHKRQVAEILYDSFTAKLIHVWYHGRDKEKTIHFLEKGLGFEYGLYALLNDRVIGFVGLDYGQGRRFLIFSSEHLRKRYGAIGGTFRQLLYALESLLVDSRANHHQTRIFPIAVSSEARGKGVGTILLNAFDEHVKNLGSRSAVLEVIDSNLQAKKLYEKQGYATCRYLWLAPLTKKAGFKGIYYMKKDY